MPCIALIDWSCVFSDSIWADVCLETLPSTYQGHVQLVQITWLLRCVLDRSMTGSQGVQKSDLYLTTTSYKGMISPGTELNL